MIIMNKILSTIKLGKTSKSAPIAKVTKSNTESQESDLRESFQKSFYEKELLRALIEKANENKLRF